MVKEFGRSQRGVQFEILGLVGLFWAYDKLLFFVYLQVRNQSALWQFLNVFSTKQSVKAIIYQQECREHG